MEKVAKALLCRTDTCTYFEDKLMTIEEGKFVRLGRKSSKETVLTGNGLFDCKYISTIHAYLGYAKNKFYIIAKSSSGTFVDGKRLEKNSSTEILPKTLVWLGAETYVAFKLHLIPYNHEDFNYLELLKTQFPSQFPVLGPPPQDEFPIEKFNDFVLERYEALKVISELGDVNSFTEETIERLAEKIQEKGHTKCCKLVTSEYLSLKEKYEVLTFDLVSHFTLRIVMCRNAVIRHWFMKQEMKFMYLRWLSLTENERKHILQLHSLNYDETSIDEMKNIRSRFNGIFANAKSYFKVPFTDATEFVRRRSAIVMDGLVYLNITDMGQILASKFGRHLAISLNVIKTNLHKIWSEKRIVNVMKYVETNLNFEGYTVTARSGAVKIDEIDSLSQKSFPLCMNVLHYQLNKDSHLRNGGRYQYLLFLKGIGVSLTDSMKFWRGHFTRKMDLATFDKRYAYHIRHGYGTVGKMADYSPLNCDMILKSATGPFDYHGCPFQNHLKFNIKNILRRNGISCEDSKSIWKIMSEGNPQLACKKYFQVVHGVEYSSNVVTHPNLYYDASRAHFKASGGADACVSCPGGNKSLQW